MIGMCERCGRITAVERNILALGDTELICEDCKEKALSGIKERYIGKCFTLPNKKEVWRVIAVKDDQLKVISQTDDRIAYIHKFYFKNYSIPTNKL